MAVLLLCLTLVLLRFGLFCFWIDRWYVCCFVVVFGIDFRFGFDFDCCFLLNCFVFIKLFALGF